MPSQIETLRLIEYWDEAKLEASPFIHPRDSDELSTKIRHTPVYNMEEYKQAFCDGTLENNKLHLTLLPQPYVGDLLNAKVVLLMANPGLDAFSFYIEDNYPDYQKAVIETIRQERKSHIHLDPQWCWTSGFKWWEQKLRIVAKELMTRQSGVSYGEALGLLACQVACIEYVPYPSTSFAGPENLPSSLMAKRAAIEISQNSERLVVVTRKVKTWGIPSADNVINYTAGQARAASLKPALGDIMKFLLEK